MSKEVLAATLQLQLRDMRLVDIEYDSQLKPYILVGQSCLSFAVGGIKVIAGESGVYVFGLDDSETANVVSRIQLAAASSAGGAPVPPLAHVALNEALLLLCEFVIVRLDRATWLVDELADVMKTKMSSSELSAILVQCCVMPLLNIFNICQPLYICRN